MCEKCDVQLCFTEERKCFRSFYTHWHFKFHVWDGRCMYTLCQWDSDDSGIQLGDTESHGHGLRTERKHDAAPAEHDGRVEMCKKTCLTSMPECYAEINVVVYVNQLLRLQLADWSDVVEVNQLLKQHCRRRSHSIHYWRYLCGFWNCESATDSICRETDHVS